MWPTCHVVAWRHLLLRRLTRNAVNLRVKCSTKRSQIIVYRVYMYLPPQLVRSDILSYFITTHNLPTIYSSLQIHADPYRSFEILTDHCPPGVLHGQAVPATRAPRALQPQPQPVTSQWRLVPRCPRCPTARRCPAAAQRGALLCLGASWVISGNGCWTCWTYSLTIIDYYDRHFRFCGFHVRSWSSYITRLCLFLLIWFCLGYRWI